MWTEEIKTKTKPSTSHSNWLCILLFDLAHKQCSGITKGWLYCLTPESIAHRETPFQSYINDWLSMMSGHCANPIFFNKKKDWTSRTLTITPPHPLHPLTSYFALTPTPSPHLPYSGSHMYIIPEAKWNYNDEMAWSSILSKITLR